MPRPLHRAKLVSAAMAAAAFLPGCAATVEPSASPTPTVDVGATPDPGPSPIPTPSPLRPPSSPPAGNPAPD
ncbi:MAG: hypothetical protein M3010_05365 [Candidatus Dormibacteraeota bacterium]|nr:hypothetical protein [Candidatus Dormibacteraeota bacterium]